MGQETWLAGRELRWADWTAPREGWDKDRFTRVVAGNET